MKLHKFLWVTEMLIINLLFILAGCTIVPSQTPTQFSENTAEISIVPASRIPSLSTTTTLPITPLASTTPDITITLTSASTSTPQPVVTETITAIPTPPGSERSQQILWLYETNNGCQLPCWWGIVPGQTDWQTAKELLSRFDQDIYRNTLPSGEIYYGVNIPLPLEVFSEDRTELGVLVRDGIVVAIQTSVSIGDTPPDHLSQYMLSMVLTTYGRPTEVWISTYSAPFEHNDLPFRVLLFYPEQGIMALYSDNGVKEGDFVRGCPQLDPASVFTLWSPTLGWTFEKVKNDSSAYNVAYLPLEETTELSIIEFYETFKNPDNLTCLETEAELWRYTQ